MHICLSLIANLHEHLISILWTNGMGWGVRWRVKMRRVIENLSSFRIGLVLTLFMITFLNPWHHFVYYLPFFLSLSRSLSLSLYSLFFKCFAQNIYDMILQKHDTCFEFVFFPLVLRAYLWIVKQVVQNRKYML